MDLDKEDAEAGSILIALANHQPQQHHPAAEGLQPPREHHPRQQSFHGQGSMSIRNLLGDPSGQETLRSSSSSSCSSGGGVSRPRPYATVSDRGPRYMYPPASMDQQARSAPSPLHMRSAARTETMQEMARSGTSDPKIRRNALHAYISYMIYTDLASHHQDKRDAPLTRSGLTSPRAFDKVSSIERPMITPQQEHRSHTDSIIHRPLTAFLRDPDPRNGYRPRSYTSTPLLPGVATRFHDRQTM